MDNKAVTWSWEGPENPYWTGVHKSGFPVGVIEYFEDETSTGGHWYFRMDPSRPSRTRGLKQLQRGGREGRS